MAVDLSKYESIRTSLRLRDEPEGAKALDELIAMVREAVGNTEHALHQMRQQKERAEAAELELAELKRMMREPDAKLPRLMLEKFNQTASVTIDGPMRAAWLAGVKHLLGDKE